MFDRIAGVYDLMNGVMTAGLHHRWRARAADLARVGPGDRVLDVATGTGDLAVELALTWHGGMRILDKIESTGARLFAHRPSLNAADKALVLARALAWRGETLPPRTLHLLSRALDRNKT